MGGHVEDGDSWSSAALHELEEEAGIKAREEDLIPFAAISGPERIFHYPDGDTQPFTMCFAVEAWIEEVAHTDTEEITKTDWFKFDEALKMDITPWCRTILLGYQEFLRTKQFQMLIDQRSE